MAIKVYLMAQSVCIAVAKKQSEGSICLSSSLPLANHENLVHNLRHCAFTGSKEGAEQH